MLLDKISFQNILIYDVLCKPLIGAKPLCIIFDKVNEFFRHHDGKKCLTGKYDAISVRIDVLYN